MIISPYFGTLAAWQAASIKRSKHNEARIKRAKAKRRKKK